MSGRTTLSRAQPRHASLLSVIARSPVTMPAGSPGNVNVNVVTPGGNSGNLSYTYVAAPTVTGVSPNAGAPKWWEQRHPKWN